MKGHLHNRNTAYAQGRMKSIIDGIMRFCYRRGPGICYRIRRNSVRPSDVQGLMRLLDA